MFWTISDVSAKIESAHLDGEGRRTIVTLPSSRPHDIALDYSSRKMYWSDDWEDKLAYANYNGYNRGYLEPRSAGMLHFGIDICSSWLYTTSPGAVLKLNQMEKTSGYLIGRTQVYGRGRGHLVVVDSSRQPSFSNPCNTNNGGCSHFCLLKPNGFTCQCSDGVILENDGKTCRIKAKNCTTFFPKPNAVAIAGCETRINANCSLKCKNGYSLLNGSTVVTCLSNGNWSSDGPTCVDSKPPIFTSCPANEIHYADSSQTARVTWATPQATDNSGKTPIISLSQGHSPASRLPEGNHQIIYKAVDEAQNEAYCMFIVKIKVIRCALPSTSGALQMQSCQNHYGGTCRFTCATGYSMVGSSTLNCQATQQWDSSVPRCDKIVNSPSSPPRRSCFPAKAKLTLNTGDVITMKSLKIGDKVQTIDAKTNEFIYTEVITFLHKDFSQGMFQDIKGEDGGRLEISYKHLVYSGKTRETMMMKFADEVKIGDFILANGTEIRVTTIKTVNGSGMYAPMTRDGTMLVNGVYVSCYADWSSHGESHIVMAPVRLWFDLSKAARYVANFVGLSWLTNQKGSGDEMSEGLHVYADVLMKLVHYLPKGISDMYYT